MAVLTEASTSVLYRVFLWFVIATTVASALATIIELLLHCHPISGLWDYMGGAVCLPTEVRATVAMVQAVVTIASDWLVALFPILILKSLNMARRTKIALAVVMCMGILYVVTALFLCFPARRLFSRRVVHPSG